MGISRSAYYDAPVSASDDTAIVEAISAICDEFERYGWRRVQAALRQQGVVVNHKKVKRLMREHGSHACADVTWQRRTATTTTRPSAIWRRTKSSTAPISSGSPTSVCRSKRRERWG